MAQYFTYGEQEIAHLKARDKRLAEIIELIGPVRREVVPDLFEALIHAIVGQQIATRAQQTIWARMRAGLGRDHARRHPGNVRDWLGRLSACLSAKWAI